MLRLFIFITFALVYESWCRPCGDGLYLKDFRCLELSRGLRVWGHFMGSNTVLVWKIQ